MGPNPKCDQISYEPYLPLMGAGIWVAASGAAGVFAAMVVLPLLTVRWGNLAAVTFGTSAAAIATIVALVSSSAMFFSSGLILNLGTCAKSAGVHKSLTLKSPLTLTLIKLGATETLYILAIKDPPTHHRVGIGAPTCGGG